MKTRPQILLLAIRSIAECASAHGSHHGNNHHHSGTTIGHHTRGGYAQDEVSKNLPFRGQ
jgi:hypothetical protein